MPVTQSKLQSDLARIQDSWKFLSEHNIANLFNVLGYDHSSIFKSLLDPKKIDDLAVGLNKDKKQLQKKLEYTRQELDYTFERLVNSQNKYTVMHEKLDWVQKKLKSTQV